MPDPPWFAEAVVLPVRVLSANCRAIAANYVNPLAPSAASTLARVGEGCREGQCRGPARPAWVPFQSPATDLRIASVRGTATGRKGTIFAIVYRRSRAASRARASHRRYCPPTVSADLEDSPNDASARYIAVSTCVPAVSTDVVNVSAWPAATGFTDVFKATVVAVAPLTTCDTAADVLEPKFSKFDRPAVHWANAHNTSTVMGPD